MGRVQEEVGQTQSGTGSGGVRRGTEGGVAMVEDTTAYRSYPADRRKRPIRTLRKSAQGWAGGRLIRAASSLGRLHPLAEPHKHDVQVERDIAYRASGSDAHLLDIYRPADMGIPRPVIFYVHGGAFQILSKDTHWMMGLMFASRGYVMASVNYRLAPTHKFPAAIHDVGAAYNWVVANIERFGGDPGQIIVTGESAGANLAMSTTLMTCFERPEVWAKPVFETGVVPRACIPACGILQVSDTHRYRRRKKMSRFVYEQIESCETGYLEGAPLDIGGTELADPLLLVESGAEPARPLPPFFTFVGTKDPLLDDTRRLERALQARGVPVEARYYPGGAHAFHAVPVLKTARQCWEDTFSFLERLEGVSVPFQRSASSTEQFPRDVRAS